MGGMYLGRGEGERKFGGPQRVVLGMK